MRVCVGIQLVYLVKFFKWETGYLCTLDIIHDRFGPPILPRSGGRPRAWPSRCAEAACGGCVGGCGSAGYYICWGFLCFVPSMYTSSALFLVGHPINLPAWKTAALIAFGVYCTYLNWSVDEEKTIFRSTRVRTDPHRIPTPVLVLRRLPNVAAHTRTHAHRGRRQFGAASRRTLRPSTPRPMARSRRTCCSPRAGGAPGTAPPSLCRPVCACVTHPLNLSLSLSLCVCVCLYQPPHQLHV
jgi:hypothetical protein